MLQVLVDADNVPASRAQPVLDLLVAGMARLDLAHIEVAHIEVGEVEVGEVEIGRIEVAALEVIASGRAAALRRIEWPAGARLLPHTGWQRADIALAAAYVPSADPLVLVTGDGDFALLAARHPGPVLVVSAAPSARLRDAATVVDPAVEGTAPVQAWLAAVAGPAGPA